MFNLQEFRAEKDEFFARHPQSPLTHEQKHAFKGLKYFPENPALRQEVSVDVFPTQESVSIQTSGDSHNLISAMVVSNSMWTGRPPN